MLTSNRPLPFLLLAAMAGLAMAVGAWGAPPAPAPAAVAQVAQEMGADLVVADQGQDVPAVEDLNFDQLRLLLNQRNVLYVSKRIDIGERVLTVLDAQYAKESQQR